MLLFLKKSLVIFSSLSILTCLISSASAYVLQGPHILELMTQKLGQTNRLFVSQTLILYGDQAQEAPVVLNEKLYYLSPENFRSDIQSENVKKIHVVSKGVALTVIDGKISTKAEPRFDRYKYLFLYHSRTALEKKLSGLGVDVSISSLGRFQGKIAYVIGAWYPDESVPQIWIDRDTFMPMRWVIMGKDTKSYLDPLEVRYLGWRQVKKNWYPMNIQFYQNDFLFREIMVDTVKLDVSFPEKTFDIEHLKSIYKPVTAILSEKGASEGIGEVQKTIEDFNKIFEPDGK
jgi:hypothetical protein